MIKLLTLFLSTILALEGAPVPKPSKIDPSTYANIDEMATSHISLDFYVDWKQ